jgi:hypothetical protein
LSYRITDDDYDYDNSDAAADDNGCELTGNLKGKTDEFEENFPQCRFVHRKSHKT